MDPLPAAPDTGQMPGRADVCYAFTARADGNLSTSVGEGPVVDNRVRLAARIGLPVTRLAFMDQVHGHAVTVIDAPADPPPQADALITSAPDVGVAVMAADCVPVLLAAGDAVAAVHAGRGGVMGDIVGEAVTALLRTTGGSQDQVVAVIGPAIGGCCYEVPVEMAEAAEAVVDGVAATTTWGTPSIDLPAAVAAQLRRRGVTDVHRAGGCTRCDPDRWFSHRASGSELASREGRQAGVVCRRAAT